MNLAISEEAYKIIYNTPVEDESILYLAGTDKKGRITKVIRLKTEIDSMSTSCPAVPAIPRDSIHAGYVALAKEGFIPTCLIWRQGNRSAEEELWLRHILHRYLTGNVTKVPMYLVMDERVDVERNTYVLPLHEAGHEYTYYEKYGLNNLEKVIFEKKDT